MTQTSVSAHDLRHRRPNCSHSLVSGWRYSCCGFELLAAIEPAFRSSAGNATDTNRSREPQHSHSGCIYCSKTTWLWVPGLVGAHCRKRLCQTAVKDTNALAITLPGLQVFLRTMPRTLIGMRLAPQCHWRTNTGLWIGSMFVNQHAPLTTFTIALLPEHTSIRAASSQWCTECKAGCACVLSRVWQALSDLSAGLIAVSYVCAAGTAHCMHLRLSSRYCNPP